MAIVSVEGNIGAGKSEVLKILKSRGISVNPEPVEAWTLLKKYYERPAAFAFSLQAQILVSFAEIQKNDKVLVMERSPRCALEVFAKMLLDEGKLSESQMSILSCMYFELDIPKTDVIIYLDLDSETCLSRIRQRNRNGEESINLNYLETVRSKYEDFLSSLDETSLDVIRINVKGLTPLEVADRIMEVNIFVS
jgi:deoxyadenosine/deoxycytidine kinase